jgi:hypothetical protein
MLFAAALLFGGTAALADESLHTLKVDNSAIEVHISDDKFSVTPAQMDEWLRRGARGVDSIYEKFPVPRVTIEIDANDDASGINGRENNGDWIHVAMGGDVAEPQLADDWVITHEMLHLAFPYMGDGHHWMNEGLSVYLEPVGRARIGIVTPKRYWKELIEGIANGQPQPGEGGLDQTATWGRTYWGGTIFWLLVDLEVREQTHGKKSIDDIVKTILTAGGNGSQQWPMQRVLEIGDQATGTHVMHDVYAQLATKATIVGFDPWWKRLGVIYYGRDVQFDDAAPLAWLRKAIIAPDGHGVPG